jgi:SAM-dependent methyltransferase
MISIFTPTHNTKWLPELYDSIKDQSFDEWVIVVSGTDIPYSNSGLLGIQTDTRIKVFWGYDEALYVGALKRAACSKCTGDILVELDHDDMLMPGAIDKIREAFEDPEVGFVYSDDGRFVDTNGVYTPAEAFNPAWGWSNYITGNFRVHRTPDPSPTAISKIWTAPDHLRAWRKDIYWQAGGHSIDMRVLDDQDLMARTYMITKFHAIHEFLYAYRITGENTWIKYSDEIQANCWRLYDLYIEDMVKAWANREGLLTVDLGGRFDTAPGYLSVDLKDADIIADLNGIWPFADNSVGAVRAFDVFEHLADPLHTMKELYRVLAPGGYAFIQVPSTDGRGAFQDPTHVSYWNENSFLYYTHYNWARYIDIPVRFMADRIYTTEKNQEQVCWVKANLVALKDNRPPGIINI